MKFKKSANCKTSSFAGNAAARYAFFRNCAMACNVSRRFCNYLKRLKLLFDAQAFFLEPQLDAVIREVSVKPLSNDELESLFAAGDTFANADSKQDDKKSKGAAMEKNSRRLLEQIFLDYKARIYGYMTCKCVIPFDRDDVFSEIMLKVAYNAESFDSAKAPLPAWVYIITRSVVADYFRKREKKRMAIKSRPLNFYLDERIDPDIEVELSELEGRLARLPERDRRAIVMRLYNDMEYGEIAMTMNLSVANVKKIYQRALKKLRGLMGYEID